MIVGHLYIIFGEKSIQIIFLVVIFFFFFIVVKKPNKQKKTSNLNFYHFIHFYMLSISHNFIGLYGERHGNPLKYSCLENPMDKGASWATVHGDAKSRTRLSNSHTHTHTHTHPQSQCCFVVVIIVLAVLCSLNDSFLVENHTQAPDRKVWSPNL